MTGRPAGLAVLGAFVLLLTGCTVAPGGSEATASSQSDEAGRTSARSGSPTPISSDPVDLPFGAAEELVHGDWLVGWNIPFKDDPRFAAVDSENWTKNGGYTYSDVETDCQFSLTVGRVADHELTEDDRRLSDTLLASTISGSDASPDAIEQMAVFAVDDDIPQDAGGKAVAFRVWQRPGPEESTLLAARVFGVMGAGMLLSVTCPGGTPASEEYKNVVRKHATINVRWPVR